MRSCGSVSLVLAFLLGFALSAPVPAAAGEEASVEGDLIANGKTVELPYVYVYALDEGFYDKADPTWKVLFVEHPIEESKLDEPVWDSAYVELGITDTAEFGERKVQVYSQSIRFAADAGGNISGGDYPQLEVESVGPERFAGHVFHPQEQEFFDDTYQYDLTFDAPLSDPNAPIGDPLPADGGEPGRAYLAWVAAIHSGGLDELKKLVPSEMAAQLESEEASEQLELMRAMTPTDIKILGGESDGRTAVLKVEGVMSGEAVQGEITLEKMGEFWMATRAAW
jgi:hypothetical protein